MEITAEQLAYWYLRLNGFFTIPNFIVHPEQGNRNGQLTDVDILGVRFSHRAEMLLEVPMPDDQIFRDFAKERPCIILAEVKTTQCKLNGPWTEQSKKNMQRVLVAVGAFPKSEIEEIAKSLYKKGYFSGKSHDIRLCCLGNEVNAEVKSKFPEVPQITWKQVKRFLYTRFESYERYKVDNEQWDGKGKELFKCFQNNKGKQDEFARNIKIAGLQIN